MTTSRQRFYEIRSNFQVYGDDGLIDRLLRLEEHVRNRRAKLTIALVR